MVQRRLPPPPSWSSLFRCLPLVHPVRCSDVGPSPRSVRRRRTSDTPSRIVISIEQSTPLFPPCSSRAPRPYFLLQSLFPQLAGNDDATDMQWPGPPHQRHVAGEVRAMSWPDYAREGRGVSCRERRRMVLRCLAIAMLAGHPVLRHEHPRSARSSVVQGAAGRAESGTLRGGGRAIAAAGAVLRHTWVTVVFAGRSPSSTSGLVALEAWRRTWDTRGSNDMARGALGKVGEEGIWIWRIE